MNILHLVGDREDAGGVLSVLRNLQEASQGTTLRHVAWVHSSYQETRDPSLQYRRSRYALAESSQHLRLLAHALPAFLELRTLLRTESYDVLHAHSRGALLVALLASRWLKLPVLFTNHNYAQRTGFYRWVASQNSMHTVVLTPNMATHYGLDPTLPHIHTISACFRDNLLQSPLVSDPPHRTASEAHPLTFIGVGNLLAWKKWDLILRALHLLPESDRVRLRFRIWGPTLQTPESQSFTKALQESRQALGLESMLTLCGPTRDVESQLRSADAFILPSTNEPCSVALMEALALGLPALVSRSGGNVDLVHEGCGHHFTPDSPESLAAVLTQWIDGGIPFKTAADIRESVRTRSATQVLQAYQQLYTSLSCSSRH